MIVCKKCGFNNADADTFCGSCGTFLEWTGQKVAQPAPPAGAAAPAEAPKAPEKKGGFFERVQKKVLYWDTPEKEKIERPAVIPGTPGAMPARPGMAPPGARPPGAPGAPGMPPGAGPPRPPGAPGMPPGAPGMPPGAGPPRPGMPPGAPGMPPGAPGMPPGAPGMPPGAPPGAMPAGAAPRPVGSPGAVPGAPPAAPPAAAPPAQPIGAATMQIMPGGAVAPTAAPPAAAPPPVAPPPAAPPPAAPPAAAVPPAPPGAPNAAGIAYNVAPVEPAPPPAPKQLPMETMVFLPGGGPTQQPDAGSGAPSAPLSWHRPDGGMISATPGAPAQPPPVAPRPAAPVAPAAPPPPAAMRPAAPPPPAAPAAPPPPGMPGAPAAVAPGAIAPRPPGAVAPPGAPGAPPGVPGAPPGAPGVPPGQPAAVRPGEARPRPAGPPRPAAPSRQLQQGDLVCAECGEGNESTRKFCRRCGHSLAEAEVVKIPWWRRLFGRGHPEDEAEAEAAEPKEKVGLRQRWGTMYSFFSTTGLMIALAVIVILSFIPGIRNPVVDKFGQLYRWGKAIVAPSFTEVHDDKDTKASTALPDHLVSNIDDGFSDTYWETDTKNLPKPDQPDTQPTVTFNFSDGIDVDQILLTSGAHGAFNQVGRPKTVQIDFEDKAGHLLSEQTVQVGDTQDPQQLPIQSVQKVYHIVFKITATNPSTLTTVAISEVEFFTKS